MSDYRYDPLQQTMSYGGYGILLWLYINGKESYGAMNSVRVGLGIMICYLNNGSRESSKFNWIE